MPIRRILLALILGAAAASPAYASETHGTILPAQKYGWGDHVGWINFAPEGSGAYEGLDITDSRVTGYAWSRDLGWINFDPADGGVTNTPDGVLGGYAWISSLGWISFSGVTINQNGEFVGIAGSTGTDAGRISFDCSVCDVATDWRPASARGGGNDGGDPGGGGGRPGQRVAPAANPGPGSAALDPGASIPAGFEANTAGTRAAAVAVPANLLDIALALEKTVLVRGEPLNTTVAFTNFGSEQFDASLAFSVIRPDGSALPLAYATTTIQTQDLVRQAIATGDLPPGPYTLMVHVVYGRDHIVEDFTQAFTIIDGTTFAQRCWLFWPLTWVYSHFPMLAWFGCWFPWMLLLIILAVILRVIWRTMRGRSRRITTTV